MDLEFLMRRCLLKVQKTSFRRSVTTKRRIWASNIVWRRGQCHWVHLKKLRNFRALIRHHSWSYEEVVGREKSEKKINWTQNMTRGALELWQIKGGGTRNLCVAHPSADSAERVIWAFEVSAGKGAGRAGNYAYVPLKDKKIMCRETGTRAGWSFRMHGKRELAFCSRPRYQCTKGWVDVTQWLGNIEIPLLPYNSSGWMPIEWPSSSLIGLFCKIPFDSTRMT